MNKPATKFCVLSGFTLLPTKLSGQAHYSVYKTYNLILGFYLNKGKFDKFGDYDDNIYRHN